MDRESSDEPKFKEGGVESTFDYHQYFRPEFRHLVDPAMKPIQQEALMALEKTLRQKLTEISPIVPESERRIEDVQNDEGVSLGRHERIRDQRGNEHTHDLWLVMDFDDVLNDTTTMQKEVRARVVAGLGLPAEEVETLWKNAYEDTNEGKKILRFDHFVAGLKERFPADRVDSILDIDHSTYINPNILRVLLAAKASDFSPNTVRISILTYGDFNYQRERLKQAGVEELVDDVIYSEGSKRAILESIRQAEYDRPVEVKHGKYHRNEPYIMTIDDSPDNLEDFENMVKQTKYINVRYSHPRAKRFGAPTLAKQVVEIEETGDQEAAVTLFKLIQLVRDARAVNEAQLIKLGNDTQRLSKNDALYSTLQHPERLDDLLWTSDPDKWSGWQGKISYQKEFGGIKRIATRVRGEGLRPQQIEHHWRVSRDGTIKNLQMRNLQDIDWPEFIREVD